MSDSLAPPEKAIHFGGMVLAHAALIASDLAEGELICPFAIVTKDDSRQMVPFEAESQAEAVKAGKASLADLRDAVDFWAFAREGLWSHPDNSDEKTDVLVVSTWTHGMVEPITLMQRFRPAASGQFVLVGPVEIIIEEQVLSTNEASPLRQLVLDGIATHPNDVQWSRWLLH
jgi:hypothetical protein